MRIGGELAMKIGAVQRVINYRLLVAADFVVSIAMGLFNPFFIVFIQGFGDSYETFGYAVSIMVGAGAITALLAGKVSDKIGRKTLLIGAAFALAAIIASYPLISSLWELFALQFLFGIVGAVDHAVGLAFLGDITEKETRGNDVGRIYAISGLAAAAALAAGGHIVGWIGLEAMFYAVAFFVAMSGAILMFIKEG